MIYKKSSGIAALCSLKSFKDTKTSSRNPDQLQENESGWMIRFLLEGSVSSTARVLWHSIRGDNVGLCVWFFCRAVFEC